MQNDIENGAKLWIRTTKKCLSRVKGIFKEYDFDLGLLVKEKGGRMSITEAFEDAFIKKHIKYIGDKRKSLMKW